MKRRKSKKRYFTIIKDSDIIKVFKTRGYRIFIGTITDDEDKRVIIEVCHRSSGKEVFEILFTPFTNQEEYGDYLFDFYVILEKVLCKANKVTRRWFIKEAKELDFFGTKLGEFLKPNSLNFDWDNIKEDYFKRNKDNDNIQTKRVFIQHIR